MVDKIHETGTILQAGLLNNLADILRQKGDLAAAEDLFGRSLVIGTARRGPDSYFVSTELQNLGIVARERKDYAARAAVLRARAGHPPSGLSDPTTPTSRSC